MLSKIGKPSPALVVACLSLAVSLGGVGYAANTLPKNSVGPAQLKKNAVTSLKVRNRSLLAADFKAGQLPAGAPGPKGDKGDKGGKGDKGDKGDSGAHGVSEHEIVTAESPANSTASKTITASCPAGKKLLGGGAFTSPTNTLTFWVSTSFPATDTTWSARGIETPGYIGNWSLRAHAICAKVS